MRAHPLAKLNVGLALTCIWPTPSIDFIFNRRSSTVIDVARLRCSAISRPSIRRGLAETVGAGPPAPCHRAAQEYVSHHMSRDPAGKMSIPRSVCPRSQKTQHPRSPKLRRGIVEMRHIKVITHRPATTHAPSCGEGAFQRCRVCPSTLIRLTSSGASAAFSGPDHLA